MKHTDLVILAAGLTAGHPVTGAYNADDALAAGEAMALNIPTTGPADAEAARTYAIETRWRTDNVLGRIQRIAKATVNDLLPFGASGADVTMTQDMITSANVVLTAIEASIAADLTTTAMDDALQDLVAAGGIGEGDKTALQALSSGATNHATQMGVGRVRPNDVTQARAL